MTELDARAEITVYAQANAEPVLDAGEVDLLVTRAKRADAIGRAPSASGWEPTWDIPYAVALGWEIKAGKCAAAYDVSSSGQSFSRSQMHGQCLAQAKVWRRRVAASAPVSGMG